MLIELSTLVANLVLLAVVLIVERRHLQFWWKSSPMSEAREQIVSRFSAGLHAHLTRRRLLFIMFMGVVYVSFQSFLLRRTSSLRFHRLIANQRTGVLHHQEACADHLPSASNRGAASRLRTPHYHTAHDVFILTEMAKNVSDEDAVELLMHARILRPSAVHVYDALIRVLGRLKRYESIHLLLRDGERELESLMATTQPNSKRYHELRRAKDALVRRRMKRSQNIPSARIKLK